MGGVGEVGGPARGCKVPVAARLALELVGHRQRLDVDVDADLGEVGLHDLRALQERCVLVDDQDGMAMAATGQAQCLGQVATERVDRDVVEAGQARGQVLVGRPLDKPCAGFGGNRVAVEGVVDGTAQPRVGERSARGVEDEVVHLCRWLFEEVWARGAARAP